MPRYLYNVETTIEVEATTAEEALDLLNDGKGDIIDRDVMLVEIICIHDGVEDASGCPNAPEV